MKGDLTNEVFLKNLLAKGDLRPNKALGQNFLICREVIEATVTALAGSPKNITELGAGMGVLTQELLAQDFNVKAIERDQGLAQILIKLIPKKLSVNLDIQTVDLREASWQWEDEYNLVGNIPYNLSGLIIRRITLLSNYPNRVVLLVQKEVGERLSARPGDINLMSLSVGLWGKAQALLNVPASCFWPQPEVDSQLVILEPKQDNKLSPEDREDIIETAKPFFQQRRKQIGSILRSKFSLNEIKVKDVLKQLDLKNNARPQEINVEKWREMHEALRDV